MKKISSLFIISLFVIAGCGKSNIVSEVNNFEECVAAENSVSESYPAQCVHDGEIFVSDVVIQTNELSSIYIISTDSSNSWNENYSEELIGCNDKLLKVVVGENLSPKEVLEKLINFEDYDVDSGEYNVFAYPGELSISEFSIENGIAVVKFTDRLVIGGMCDSPRVSAQIRKTLLQYPEIDEVEIYVGEENIYDYLSEK